MKKKKKINMRKFLTTILAIVVIVLVIKLGVKNIIKKDNADQSDNVITAEAENKDEEEKQTTNETEEIQSDVSNKQKSIKEDRLASGKTLSSEGLPVLMYHFFYDKSKGETGQDGNWVEISNFEEQMKYLSENGFYFPIWQEVEDYIDGKQELP